MKTPPDNPSRTPAGGYRIELFDAQNGASAQDIIAMWIGEGALGETEARRRVSELLLVATDGEPRPVAVATTYLARNDQLRAELWHTRVFVASAHRQSHLAVALALMARDELVRRFREGHDRRGIGVLFEVESEILKRFLPQATWRRTQSVFIGESAVGAHLRVYYFPGALAPEPGQGST